MPTKKRKYSDPRWNIREVRSSQHRPHRIWAVSDDQAVTRTRRHFKLSWIENPRVFIVQAYSIHYLDGSGQHQMFISGINPEDATIKFLNNKHPGCEVSSIVPVGTLRKHLEEERLDPDKNIEL